MALTARQLHDVWEVLEFASQSAMETLRRVEDASHLVRPAGNGLEMRLRRLAVEFKEAETEIRAVRKVLYEITPEVNR